MGWKAVKNDIAIPETSMLTTFEGLDLCVRRTKMEQSSDQGKKRKWNQHKGDATSLLVKQAKGEMHVWQVGKTRRKTNHKLL